MKVASAIEGLNYYLSSKLFDEMSHSVRTPDANGLNMTGSYA